MKNCWTFVVCTLIALACIDSVRTINSTFAYHVLPTQMRHQRTSLRPATTSSALASRPVSTTSEQPDLTTETDDDAAAEPDEEEHHDSDHQLMHAKHVPSPAKVPVLPVNSGKAKTSTLTAAEYELAPSDLLNNLHSDELPVEHNEHYGHDELTPALSSQLMNSANHFLQLSRPTRLNVSTKPQFPQRKQLLIVSFDAFRYDYNRMFRRQMPHFERIAREGVWAPMGIQTAYVTKTFPTHFSIATGLYEESHGIIDNTFFDPELNETFTIRPLKSKFFHGEPIWITAVKNELQSRVYFWPGSEVPTNGLRPTTSFKYNASIPLSSRFEQALEWLDNGSELAMVYFHEPDASGHRFGVGSIQMAQAIAHIDHHVGLLMDELRRRPNVNVVFLADHGMVNLKNERLVVLEDHLDLRNDVLRIPQYGNVAAIQPKPGRQTAVMQKLLRIPGIRCYEKNQLPENLHYKHCSRVMPIICIPDLGGYIIRTSRDARDRFGSHGYDNHSPQMRPIFYAHGPDFKQQFKTAPFETVNLYSMFCHILGIQPAPNNGSLANVRHLLSTSSLTRLHDLEKGIAATVAPATKTPWSATTREPLASVQRTTAATTNTVLQVERRASRKQTDSVAPSIATQRNTLFESNTDSSVTFSMANNLSATTAPSANSAATTK